MMHNDDKQKILIVDDQPENIRVLMDSLGDDYQFIATKDGPSALSKASQHLPDIILLDIMMPVMDGFEVCRELKNNEQTKNIPVIFVTAIDDAQDEEKGLKLGAIDYIRKPFHLAVTKARINNHLKLKHKADLLEDLVRLDGLTEIHNRRALDETLSREWKVTNREKLPLSLVLIDIDYFKKYNDHYGHAKGDDCLILVARALRCTVKRPQDFVARYGGEEFAVLLPNTEQEGAQFVAQSACDAVNSLAIPHAKSLVDDYVTISAGVATIYPKAGDSERTLLTLSDKALYQAKEAGRNRVRAIQKETPSDDL